MAKATIKNNKLYEPRDEHNRAQRKLALVEFDRLVALACAPDFDGTIELTIPAKAGRLGRVKIGYNQHL